MTIDHIKSNIAAGIANNAVNHLIAELAQKAMEADTLKAETETLKARIAELEAHLSPTVENVPAHPVALE